MVMDHLLQVQSLARGRLPIVDSGSYQEIVLSILENHVDRLVFQNDFLERNNVLVGDLSVQLDPFREPRDLRGG